jgi:transcriptional regulator with XRE-family HTH domain
MGGNRRKSGDCAAVGAFGTVLRLHRQSLALSQEDLADATHRGVAARTISDLERGVARRPRSATVRMLAEALGLAGAELAAFKAAARAGRRAPAAETLAAEAAADLAKAGPLIIVADAARLAEVESLLSAVADCLVLVTGGRLLPGADTQAVAVLRPRG